MVEISVIIPVYNCEDYLDESVNGILNQTFKDIEVICVDDGSTDNSLQKLKDFAQKDNRVQVYHQENQGGGAARNFALTKALGKYVYFMDADDILYSDALEKCYDLCEEKKVDFLIFKAINYKVSTDEYFETEYFSMNRLYNIVGDEVFSIDDIGENIFNMSVTPWGKLYDRKFIMSTGAQFAVGISFHDNKFFWDMLFQSKKIIFLNEILYVRRLHSSSLIGSKNRGYFNSFIAFNQVFDIFKKHNKFDEFKNRLYNWKVDVQYFRFKMIHEEYKQEFLDRLKEEHSKMANEEGLDDFLEILNPRNTAIYQNAKESETYKEFGLLMEKYELDNQIATLKNENNKLKKSNNDLKSKNKKLKNKYEKSMKLNEELLDSKSWKITKPLRKIRNLK